MNLLIPHLNIKYEQLSLNYHQIIHLSLVLFIIYHKLEKNVNV